VRMTLGFSSASDLGRFVVTTPHDVAGSLATALDAYVKAQDAAVAAVAGTTPTDDHHTPTSPDETSAGQ